MKGLARHTAVTLLAMSIPIAASSQVSVAPKIGTRSAQAGLQVFQQFLI